MKKVCIILTLLLPACATSNNMRVGQEQSYESLQGQRAAILAVQLVDIVPSGAISLGKVEASRCHRSMLDNTPGEDNVVIDLKVAAYAKGADMISNIQINKNVGGALLKNCWHVKNGTADIYQLPKVP